MMPGYHKIFNNIALQGLARKVYEPDPVLGVGVGQDMGSQPLTIHYRDKSVRAADVSNVRTTEDIMTLGSGRAFTPEDFPREFYMGGIGGIGGIGYEF